MKMGTNEETPAHWLWGEQKRLFSAAKMEPLTCDAIALTGPEAAPPSETPKDPPKRFKWATSLDYTFKFDFANAIPMECVPSVTWDESIKGVDRSASGSGGVFFVDTSGGALVIKGSKQIATELFASMVCLRFAIHTPCSLVVATDSHFGAAMLARLKTLDKTGRLVLSLHDQLHVMLMEYVCGTTLGSVKYERACQVFGSETSLSVNGKKRLREIGRLMGVDCLLNNSDRLPLVWDNRGNPGNLMLAGSIGCIVAIDNQFIPVDVGTHPERVAAQRVRVEELCRCVRDNPGVPLTQFQRICDKLLEYTGFTVGTEGVLEMQEGFAQFVALISATDRVGFEGELKSWRDAIRRIEPKVISHDMLDVDYVMAMFDAMRPLAIVQEPTSLF
eukprot:Opistho-2@41187